MKKLLHLFVLVPLLVVVTTVSANATIEVAQVCTAPNVVDIPSGEIQLTDMDQPRVPIVGTVDYTGYFGTSSTSASAPDPELIRPDLLGPDCEAMCSDGEGCAEHGCKPPPES